MKRSLEIVQAQIAALSDVQRELEHITGRIVVSTAEPVGRMTGAAKLQEYVANKLSDLRFEVRQIRNRANVDA